MTTLPTARDAELRRFLEARNVGCPACGYNLRGLERPICPECGAQVDLTVLLIIDRGFRQRRKWLIGAWIALVASAGVERLLALVSPAALEMAAQTGVMAAIGLVAAAVVAVADESIYRDRLRYPLARTLPPFGRVVTATIGFLLLCAATQLARTATMFLP